MTDNKDAEYPNFLYWIWNFDFVKYATLRVKIHVNKAWLVVTTDGLLFPATIVKDPNFRRAKLENTVRNF